jgi:DNA polymerase-3 subunit epsilon
MTNTHAPLLAALNLALFYDFETTGLPLWSEPSEDPRQPHITQVGAQLVDLETRIVVSSLDLTVMPDGWSIPDEAAAMNGLTTERALAVGVPETLAITALLALWRRAKVRIAHNESFDARIGRIAIKRLLNDEDLAEEWKSGEAYCTCTSSTGILMLPPTGRMRGGYKKPNLAEAYGHFTGQQLTNAHSAGPDTEACKRVYFGIEDHLGATQVAA